MQCPATTKKHVQCKNTGTKKWVDGKMYCGPHHDKLVRDNPGAVGEPMAIIDNGTMIGVHVPGEGNTTQEQLFVPDDTRFEEMATEWVYDESDLDEFALAALPDEADVKPVKVNLSADELEEQLKAKLAEGRKVEQVEGGTVMRPDPLVLIRKEIHGEECFVVAGTGSRELQKVSNQGKELLMQWLIPELERIKEKYGDKLIIMSGMAEGFDKAFAMAAIQLGIRLWCVIPSKNYGDYYWNRTSLTGRNMMGREVDPAKGTFRWILNKAWKVTYVMEDIYKAKGRGVWYVASTNTLNWNKNGRHTNMVRNDAMVALADAFYVYDPSTPGTSDCFNSIRKANKPYILVPVLRAQA
ncbi:MAG TPA: hypothetical protein VJ742_12495 [Nitrososphaera sp.]|nr:hypothetical protein [Nitrososphaera sp.]